MAEDARQDDRSILEHDRLLRRVSANQLCPEADGSQRPSSAVFKNTDKNTELSINIESLMTAQGGVPEDSLKSYPGQYLVSVTAGQVREQGPDYPIVKDNELPQDPAHGLVLGKKTGRFANAMVRCHRWVVPPLQE